MPTLNGITYQELVGSAHMEYSYEDGWRGKRIFYVDWSDRKVFCEALLGYSEGIGDTSIRVVGQQFPGYNHLYCRDLDIEGVGELAQGADMASYDKARVSATYRPHRFTTSTAEEEEEFDEEDEEALAHLEEQWDFSGEYLSIPSSGFTWEDDGSAVNENVGIMVGTADIVLTSDQEPILQRALVAAALGRVNSVTWYGFTAGHVLFLGAAARRVITAEGSTAWTITYRFRARTVSWNDFWKPVPTAEPAGGTTTTVAPGLTWGWTQIVDDDGDPIYDSYNFYNLF